MSALVNERPTGAFDSDSILLQAPKRDSTRWVLSLFGGLEGDRTLEPHGCEPCALPAELQALISLEAKLLYHKFSVCKVKDEKVTKEFSKERIDNLDSMV